MIVQIFVLLLYPCLWSRHWKTLYDHPIVFDSIFITLLNLFLMVVLIKKKPTPEDTQNLSFCLLCFAIILGSHAFDWNTLGNDKEAIVKVAVEQEWRMNENDAALHVKNIFYMLRDNSLLLLLLSIINFMFLT